LGLQATVKEPEDAERDLKASPGQVTPPNRQRGTLVMTAELRTCHEDLATR
jgi:hypothetical protein